MPHPNPFTRVSSVLTSLCLLLIAASICQAQFFTLPGSFSYALNSINQVFDVTPDGKMAVALRNNTGSVHSALLTSFDPISGRTYDSKVFGFGPLGVQLAQTTAGLRAVVLTSEGGPRTIYIFDVSPTGQLTLLSTTRLTSSNGDGGSNLVLSASAQVGFTIVYPSSGLSMELITFSLADGSILNRLLIGSGANTLKMIETSGQRKLAFMRDISTLGVVDATDPIHPTISGNVALPRNSAFSAGSTAGIAFSGDGRYVFVANGFVDFSAVDLSTNQVVASIGGKYSFGRVKIHENSQRRWLAIHSDTSETGAGGGTVLLVDATDPTRLSILKQFSFPSIYKSDIAFSQSGSRLFLSNANTLLAVDLPSFTVAWERRTSDPTGREQQVMTFGQPEEVLSAWDVFNGLGFVSLFGSFPAVFPDISINDVTVTEGDSGQTSANFTVTLSAPTTHRVTVSYNTADGTAVAGSDFVAASGTVVLEAGETSKVISVPVKGDLLDEFDETFALTLSNPTIGNLVRGSGTCTIMDEDPQPTISISDASVTEGDAGNATLSFTAGLSAPSGKTITVSYETADLTALAGSDYVAASGSLIFSPGQMTRAVSISVKGDTVNEANETFAVNLSAPINVTIGDGQAIGTIVNDDTPTVRFGQSSHTVSEDVGSVNIVVTRGGDASAAATVKYATSDQTDANFRCDPTTPNQATIHASRKCDYHIASGTLRFAAGETSKQFSLSIVDDAYAEVAEAFTITLSNPVGATLGQISTATVSITDNDTSGQPNPIDNTRFYVRQLYVDLLSREPDPAGWNGWTTRIDQCGQPGQPPPPCDRVTVGGDGFLRSGEFFDRQFFVLRLYRTGLGRILRYDEISDLAYISGFLTAEQLELNKQDLVAEMVLRDEFANRYNPLSNGAFVQTLLQTAGVTVPQSVQDSWIAALDNSSKTRAQVFREISERQEVSDRHLHEAQVVSAYYGFFTRNPDGAYLNYLQRLDSGEITLADLANAFINAQEYRQRFGQ